MACCVSVGSLEVQVGMWAGLILVASIAVGFFCNFLAMLIFFIASLAASVIGFMSVFAIVIVISPNHSTSSSVIPKHIIHFQDKVRVSDHFA